MGNHTHPGSQISVVCNPNNPTNQGDSGGKNHPNQPPPPPWVSRTTWDRNQPNNSTSAHSAALNRHEPAHPTPCGCPETPHPPPTLPTNQLCRLRNQRPTHLPHHPHPHGSGSNPTVRRPKRSNQGQNNQDAPSPRLLDTPTRHHPTHNQTHAKTIPTHPNTGSNHNHIPPTPHQPEPGPERRQERGQGLELEPGNPTPTSPTPGIPTPTNSNKSIPTRPLPEPRTLPQPNNPTRGTTGNPHKTGHHNHRNRHNRNHQSKKNQKTTKATKPTSSNPASITPTPTAQKPGGDPP